MMLRVNGVILKARVFSSGPKDLARSTSHSPVPLHVFLPVRPRTAKFQFLASNSW